jgi:hypothetical protein
MPDQRMAPWTVTTDDYPAQGSAAEQQRFLLNYAVPAPSGHNTQPWLFRVSNDSVEIYADRTRALPVVDPDDRELVISCGAALFNLRLALRHFGYTDQIELLPDPGNPDLLARIRRSPGSPATDDEQALFAAIPTRRTNRQPFAERAVPAAVLADLQQAVAAEGAWLQIVADNDTRNALADLIAEGDRIQGNDPQFRRELAAWIHPNRTRSRDGMPGYAHGMGDLISNVMPFVIRTFDWGKGIAARDRRLATGSPVLVVLGTDADTSSDWPACGQALERLLLLAHTRDIWASYLNQSVEVAALRPRLQALLERPGYPQIILRMGYGPGVAPPTPRRPPRAARWTRCC